MANQTAYFGLLPLPEDCTHDMWNDYKRHIVRVVDELDRQHDELSEKSKDLKELADPLPWMVGDWLLSGVRLGEKSGELKEWMQQYLKGGGRKGYSIGALGNIMTICKAFPAFPISRRRESLSIWYHWEIYKFSEEDQEKLLDAIEGLRKTEDGHKEKLPVQTPMPFRKLKALIAQMRSIGHLPKDSRPIITVERAMEHVTVKVSVTRAVSSFLKAIDPQSSSALTAARIIQEYIAVNLDSLISIAADHDARWGTPYARQVLTTPGRIAAKDGRLPRIYLKS